MKAAIYCRLSKEDEEQEKRSPEQESESIQNQRSMLVSYAREKGYEVYCVYADEDYSGADRDRPAFNRMIEDARRRRFEIILAKTQSRFTRDMELVEKYLHGKFIEWGVRFIAVVDHVDTADDANKKSRQINGLVNEWYLEDLSANIRSVLTHKRKAGKYIASFALYGYRKDEADHNHLVVDPEAAQTVRRIFALYLAGSGPSRIARLLNEEGVPSPTQYRQDHGGRRGVPARCRNEALWGKATVYRMLTNRTYAGDLEQGRHTKVSYKSKKTAWVPKDQWIIVPDTHEAIIGRETFDRVQQLLHQRARSGAKGQVNPLAGKVFCGLCGCAMEQTGAGYTGKNGGPARRYFRCRMSQRAPARCPGQAYLPLEQLQGLVLGRVRRYVAGCFTPEELDRQLPEPPAEKTRQAKRGELQRAQGELRRRRKAVQELYLDKSSGLVSADQFLALNRSFLQEAEQLEKRCQQLEEELRGDLGAQAQRERLKALVEEAVRVKSLDRELAALLIRRVVVYPPDPAKHTRKIEIHWNF